MKKATVTRCFVRVTFRDGSAWHVDVSRPLERWAILEADALCRSLGIPNDLAARFYATEQRIHDILKPVKRGSEFDLHVKRRFVDWLAATYRWEQLRQRERIEPPHGIYGNHTAEWPRADIEIVEAGE